MEGLSELEQQLYDYIKDKKEATLDGIKKDLPPKAVGAIGKLIQKGLITKSKKPTGEQVPTGYGTMVSRMTKVYTIKEKDNE